VGARPYPTHHGVPACSNESFIRAGRFVRTSASGQQHCFETDRELQISWHRRCNAVCIPSLQVRDVHCKNRVEAAVILRGVNSSSPGHLRGSTNLRSIGRLLSCADTECHTCKKAFPFEARRIQSYIEKCDGSRLMAVLPRVVGDLPLISCTVSRLGDVR
jgi:hypothetical protein